MMKVLIVFLGAGLGGALRHLVNGACLRWCGPDFPYGIMLINSLGSFLMGLLAGYLAFQASEGWSQSVRLFLATGVLGGFTTFSTFSLDAVLLWERGEILLSSVYVLGSVALGIAGLIAGLSLMRALS